MSLSRTQLLGTMEPLIRNAAVVEFERYFEFVMNEVVYRVLETEIDDGVIKSTTAKSKP